MKRNLFINLLFVFVFVFLFFCACNVTMYKHKLSAKKNKGSVKYTEVCNFFEISLCLANSPPLSVVMDLRCFF